MKPADLTLAAPVVGEREEALVLEVLRSGQLSLGPMVERFEHELAAWLGADDAVAVSSGTAALHLAVRELGWGRGAEVITTPLSFVASSNCLLFEDATPVFVDIDPVTMNLDPAQVERAIGERTAGILPVHIFGYPAAMPEVEVIAAERRLGLLEDACQALGAVDSEGRRVGARGHHATFGFYPNKQLTTGEGGALIPPGAEAAERARSERNQGRAADMGVVDHPRLGFNYRLSDVAAAIGVAQLERLDAMLADRARVAALYDELLIAAGAARAGEGDPDGLVLPCANRGEERRSWFVYVVQVPAGADRDGVIARLAEAGVQAKAYLPVIHLMPFYRERFGFRGGEFPIAERVASRSIALPFHPALTEAEVATVVGTLRVALGR